MYPWNAGGQSFMSAQNNYPAQQNNYSMRQNYPFTNISYVTSLEEALMRTTQFDSDMIYFNQDRNEFYRIRVGLDGRKTSLTLTYSLPEQSCEDKFSQLLARVEALEKLVKKDGTEDGKLDG